jgi:hypothetical protein
LEYCQHAPYPKALKLHHAPPISCLVEQTKNP